MDNLFTLSFIQNLRPAELIIIFLIILLLFGAKRLPDLFRSIGQSIKEFKKATSDVQDGIQRSMEEGESGTDRNDSARTPSSPAAKKDDSAKDDPPSNA